VLEDVELAVLAKRRKVGLRFRYADDALSARMYRSAAAMIEGWTKNLALLWVRTLVRFYARVAKSNFPFVDCALAPLGLPLFVVLLYRSWFQHRILKRVSWKGRTYPG